MRTAASISYVTFFLFLAEIQSLLTLKQNSVGLIDRKVYTLYHRVHNRSIDCLEIYHR